MYFEKGMKLFRHVTLKSSTASSKVVIVEMFLEEGEINPAYPFLVTVMINPCFNEAKNTFLEFSWNSIVLGLEIINDYFCFYSLISATQLNILYFN